ncbi:MAG: AmmeMemoRadiSam system protein B [Acidobacteria bacterium]|nr:AmmeMemoRadiSam system protein B [Acidobacteriota bacterium]
MRPSAIAGSWYPGSKSLALAEVHRMTRVAVVAPLPGAPVALVVPHAGWRYSGTAAAAAFRAVRPGAYDRVVVIAPSHHGGFSGFAIPDVAGYSTPLGDVPLAADACAKLRDGELARDVPGVDDHEHAIEIELPFLQALGSFKLVPVLAGQATAEMQRRFAARLAALHDGRTLYVFSSDFTHYGPRFGYTPFGPSAMKAGAEIKHLADRAIGYLSARDAAGFRAYLEETGDTICGRNGLGVLLELLPKIAPDAKPTVVARYTSTELPDSRDDNSVSYVAMTFGSAPARPGEPMRVPPPAPACPPRAPEIDAALGQALVGVARATLRTELSDSDDLRRALAALPDRAELDRLQAVFVTLKRTDPREIARYGDLRGCVGQVWPTYPLSQAVVISAIDAALNDHRFEPVQASELDRLAVEVTVLSPPHPVESWREIQVGKHGVVLEQSGRRALFLPQVATEQGWNVEQTLDALARKAGLATSAWREPGAKFSVFTGQVFEEHGHGP